MVFGILGSVISQKSTTAIDQCGTMQNLERLKIKFPELEKNLEAYETKLQQWIAENPQNINRSSHIIIPTVIHVVWNTASENISNTICNQIIQVLNEDYGRTNSDTNLTPAVWKPISANTGIQFCLAQRAPDGSPTNGIERTYTTSSNFTTDDAVKSAATGGADSWDVTKYFNIWICDLVPGLGGYGEFPSGTASPTYGNVTDYQVVGTGEWVCTHESGHCFNLRHIWGDDGGACSGSDLVSDTPNQADATSSTCPSFPTTDACTGSAPGIMFMNYMDYGGNACKNLFTMGQSSRINAILGIAPYNALKVSDGCVPVVLANDDAGNPLVNYPTGMVCSYSFSPQVNLRNWGTDTLFTCDINYQIDAGPIQTYNWIGSLPSLAILNVTLPTVTTTAGNHTFKSYTTNPNSVTDGNTANDTTGSNFNVVVLGQSLPFSYGFEPATFPPTGWSLYNPDGAISWARRSGVAKTGTASMWFNSKNYTCNGCIDIITLPNLDLTTATFPQLTFQVAYRLLSDPSLSPNWSDTLRVDLSNDCGQTWNNLYFKAGTSLTTIVPTFSTTAFTPTASNWRLETLDLSSFASNNNVLLRFKVTSDYENNLYVDDINISSPTGVASNEQENFISVFPNPQIRFLTLIIL